MTFRTLANRLFLCVTSAAFCAGACGCSLRSLAEDHEARFHQLSCLSNDADPAAAVTIFLIDQGWHTGIVLPAAELLPELRELLPETRESEWIEVGWGDKEFYRAAGYSYSKAFLAAFFSSGAVLHVASFNEPPREFFRNNSVVLLRVERGGFDRIGEQIRSSLLLSAGKAIPLGPSLYGRGSFYEASGYFSILHTCNSWTAEALHDAGCPVKKGRLRASSILGDLGAEG